MTYKTLTPQKIYIISINPNEEIMETLQNFVKEQGIKSGYVTGIGAVKSARLGAFNPSNKKYIERKIKKPLEMTNLVGNITSDKIHLHATFSSQMFVDYSGHLVRAVVSAACEIVIVETEEEIKREFSEEIGLDLLNLS